MSYHVCDRGGGGDASPAVGIVKSGVVGSAAWTAGRYVAKDGQRFRIGRGFEPMFVFCGPGAPAAKRLRQKRQGLFLDDTLFNFYQDSLLSVSVETPT